MNIYRGGSMLRHIIILFSIIFTFSIHTFAEDAVPEFCSGAKDAVLAACTAKKYEIAQELATDQNYFSSLEAQVNQVRTNISAIKAPPSCMLPPVPPAAALPDIPCQNQVDAALNSLNGIEADISAAKTSQVKCTESHSKGDLLCKLTSSPQAQMGTQIMNQLTSSLTGNSAKETCDSTSKAGFASQSLLAAGAAMCAVNKTACNSSCGEAVASLEAAQGKLDAALATLNSIVNLSAKSLVTTATSSTTTAISQVKSKEVADSALLAKCSGYAAGLAQLTQTAASLMQQAQQAKACSDQLAGNTANQSMDQMCATNPETPLCKCRTNNTAQGCPGYMAGLKNEGNLKLANTGGASNMAGLSYGKVTPKGDLGMDLGDISDEAKEILAKTEDPASSGIFSTTNGAGIGSPGATTAATMPDKGGGAPESKSLGSSFMNAVGSMFRGNFGGGSGARPSNSKFEADKYKIQRQIAEYKKEVSPASGLDNFEKIARRYKSNVPTFLQGN